MHYICYNLWFNFLHPIILFFLNVLINHPFFTVGIFYWFSLELDPYLDPTWLYCTLIMLDIMFIHQNIPPAGYQTCCKWWRALNCDLSHAVKKQAGFFFFSFLICMKNNNIDNHRAAYATAGLWRALQVNTPVISAIALLHIAPGCLLRKMKL